MGKVDKYLNWVRIKVNICKKLIQWLPQSGFRGCVLCRALTSEMVCQDCYTFLPHFKPGCNRCGYPVLSLNSHYYCDECEQIEPAFDSILALFHYIWPVHFWIRKLKFEHKLEIAHFFGQKMAESFSLLIKPDVIVPVPLHIQRHRQRP